MTTTGKQLFTTLAPDGTLTVEVAETQFPDPTGNQLSLAFECGSPEEVDELYARVVGAGFDGEKEPWDAFWGQRYAQLADPDGVPVDLFAALPSTD